MLIFESIRIRNFRAIKELTFQPKTEGITGIFGPNGKGKTSILHAVTFALYGVTPKGVTTNALRRQGSGKEECSVSVVFSHLGQKVEVIRELKPSGKSSNVVVNIYVDGREETVTSVGAANKWMQRRFGVDAEGFLTAFVVRQKELDAFVTAVPSERKKIIEKLAGVETINRALIAAREAEKDSRKIVESLPGSEESVENAGLNIDFYSEQKTTAEEQLEATREQMADLQRVRSNAQDNLAALGEKKNLIFQLETNIASSQRELTSLDGQIERVQYIETVSEEETAESLRKKYAETNKELTDLRNASARLSVQSEALNRQKQDIENQLTATQDEQKKPEYEGLLSAEKLQEAQETAVAEQQDILRRIDRLETMNNDLAVSVELLGHSAECPTCHTNLEDPEALVGQFQKTIESNSQEIQKLGLDKASVAKTLAELQNDVRKVERFSQLQSKAQELSTKLQEVSAEIANIPSASMNDEQIQKLSTELETITRNGLRAKEIENDRNLFNSLTTRKEQLAMDLRQFQDALLKETKNTKLNDITKYEQELQSTQRQYDVLSNKIAELTGTLKEAEYRFESAREAYKRFYDQWERKKKMVEAHARKTLTTDMLEQFRHDTVSSIAPELSDYATSLISEMTNGDFIEVKLDEDFKASMVKSNGDELAATQLSGGEESVLALALRLATAFLITGGSSEMMWLDEPLTAQDADRRASILALIRNLPIKQIIMINHAQEAQDIVDYEVTLGKEEPAVG